MAIVPDPLLKASKLPIIIGIIFILIHFSFVYLPNAFLMTPDPAISAIGSVLAFLSPFFFIIVFGWTGWRATRQFQMGIVDSGSVSAFSYVILSSISIVMTITFLLSLPFIFHSIYGDAASSDFLSSSEVKASGFGLVVILMVYALSVLIFGTLINFGIGCLAGLLAKRIK